MLNDTENCDKENTFNNLKDLFILFANSFISGKKTNESYESMNTEVDKGSEIEENNSKIIF